MSAFHATYEPYSSVKLGESGIALPLSEDAAFLLEFVGKKQMYVGCVNLQTLSEKGAPKNDL